MANKQYYVPTNSSSGTGGGGGVTSFNTRTGAVTPQTGDYSIGQITGATENVTVNVSSAQILALNTSPVLLVSAPGAGKLLVLRQVVLNYVAGGTGYTGAGGNLQLFYGTASGSVTVINNTTMPDTFLNGTSNQVVASNGFIPSVSSQIGSAINKAISLNDNNGNPTLGNGTMVVTVWYNTITAS